MAKERKLGPLSEGAKLVYDKMVELGVPLTMAELKDLGVDANPAHFTAMRNRGLISAEKVEKEVATVVLRKMNEYSLIEGAEAPE